MSLSGDSLFLFLEWGHSTTDQVEQERECATISIWTGQRPENKKDSLAAALKPDHSSAGSRTLKYC